MEYLTDLVYIPFANSAIDTPVTEYMESGLTSMQTPRHWAKSLVASDGTSLEIDLENGKADGSAIITSPSASAAQVKEELTKFWKRQNPTLSNAKELYTASLSARRRNVSSMAQFKTGTFCWADHGLNLAQTPIQQKLKTPILAHFGAARSACSYSILPPGPTALRTGYQPGGTFTATTGKWVTRSTGKPIVDPSGLGRWSGLSFLGKRGKRLAIITAHRSPRQQPTEGYGFFDQQYSLLVLLQGIPKPNVRKQFIHDIIESVNKLQLDGHEVILSLDANETIGQEKTDGIASVIEACTLHDLHSLQASTPPATYKYGTNRRIDYMLGSASVRECARKAGYLEDDNGVFSKHRGMFIDLNFETLMGTVDKIAPLQARGIRLDDQPSVDRYLAAFQTYADEHNIWKRVSELVTVAPSMPARAVKDCYDAIDRDVTRGMLHAEKLAKRITGKYAWSPKLCKAGLIARYWNLRLREVQKGIDLRVAIDQVVKRIKSLNIVFDNTVNRIRTGTGTGNGTGNGTGTGTGTGTDTGTGTGTGNGTGTEHNTDTSNNHDTGAGTDTDTGTDAPTIEERWKASIKVLRKIRDTAYDPRAVHLKTTLEQYMSLKFNDDEESEADENVSKIRRIHQLINIESMQKPFRAIHSSVTPGNGGGLSKLFVPSGVKDKNIAARYCSPDGSVNCAQMIKMAQSDKHSVEYKTILDPDEINAELLRYNREWFRQAADTPFGYGELFDMVGFSGTTPEADAIINGDCIAHMGIPMSREIETFLEECRQPDSVSPVDPVISVSAFVKTIKDWKETTSTSPSGRHLGHYRTAILDQRIATLHTDLLNIPTTYGFAPDRWPLSVTPLIKKDEGLPYLTRLRVIHLFEADYNLILKLVYGKRLVKNAEKANALNNQQHGSRPRRMTTDALILAQLEKDIIRQIKSNSAHMDNDATGCYDRIVVSLGMMACRRAGMPKHATACQANALCNMRYAIKQLTGISPKSDSGTPEDPLFGTGQGSGASGATWLRLAVILLNCLDRLSKEDDIPGMFFADPWNEILAAWRVSAFVDDTNQAVMDPTGKLSLPDLVEQMRKAGQLWETLLHISGGALNLAKCSWTVQFW